MTSAALRRPISQQKSTALGFCPLSSEAHAHSPVCGRKADGHRLISKPGSYTQ